MKASVALMLLALAACAQVPSQEADRLRMRGHVAQSGQGFVFQACDSQSSPQSLQDSISTVSLEELMGQLGYGDDAIVFIDMVFQTESSDLEATRLIHAAHGETRGCDENPDFLWKAGGNEPFWSVHVGEDETRVSRLAETTREWRFPTPVAEAQGQLLRYSLGEADGAPVELELNRNPCRDSMSGHYFAYDAVLGIGAEQLTGCARTGLELPMPGPKGQF
ncbi:hypothetical protein [Fodinicurvata sediminis]|uniref:hypothetical protein n=1 Tax=Fodinicurvata sediminis TaxID=1121832 RepID=UPI0003B6F47E|nr:hypothetical protein [Fodinicurvata sediminis]